MDCGVDKRPVTWATLFSDKKEQDEAVLFNCGCWPLSVLIGNYDWKFFLYRAFPSIDLDWRVKLQKQVSNCPTLSDTRIFGKNMTAQAKTKNQPARLILGEIWHRWRGVVAFKIYSTVNLNLNKKIRSAVPLCFAFLVGVQVLEDFDRD